MPAAPNWPGWPSSARTVDGPGAARTASRPGRWPAGSWRDRQSQTGRRSRALLVDGDRGGGEDGCPVSGIDEIERPRPGGGKDDAARPRAIASGVGAELGRQEVILT